MIAFDSINFESNFIHFWFKICLIAFLVYFSLKLFIKKWHSLENDQVSHRQKQAKEEDFIPFYPNGWLPVLELQYS